MDLLQDRAKLKELYMPGTEDFVLVDVPELPFATIDGEGTPQGGAGAAAIKCLFTVIQPIRREARARAGKDFVDAPLEFLYTAQDAGDLAAGRRDRWTWRAMVTLPHWADEATLADAMAQVRDHLTEIPESLRVTRFAEGLSAQIMHMGPADDIPALLDRLYRRYLPDNGLVPAGAYHEIYLDDWHRTAPERRKIVLRQPVRRA